MILMPAKVWRTIQGLVVLARLAQKADVFVPAVEIAEIMRVHPKTVREVLKPAVDSRILYSRRCTHGGYALLDEPRAITLWPVWLAAGGPTELELPKKRLKEKASDEAAQALHQRLLDSIVAYLKETTLAKVAGIRRDRKPPERKRKGKRPPKGFDSLADFERHLQEIPLGVE